MFATQKNKLKLTKTQYKFIRELNHNSKSLYNVYLYESKKYYQETGKFLNYKKAWNILKHHYNYKILPNDVAQQTMKILEQNWKSYFALLKKENYKQPIQEPKFLPKDGHFVCVFPRRKNSSKTKFEFFVPKQYKHKYKFKSIKVLIPEHIKQYNIKQIRILPKVKGTYFEIEYIYEIQPQEQINSNKVLAIDTGVNNFAACLDSSGRSFLLDGRKMKSINRLYNKKVSYYKTILSKQNLKSSKKLKLLGYKNSIRLNECLNQYVNFIITYCQTQNIGKVIVGTGHLAQNNSNLGKTNNQNFVMLPFGKFIQKLQHKCERYGIAFQEQEESYTSKCDHLAYESMEHHDKYLGRRYPRGLFKSSTGIIINADIHGALGIMLKSGNGDSLRTELSRGKVTLPLRIRLDDIQQTSSVRLIGRLFS